MEVLDHHVVKKLINHCPKNFQVQELRDFYTRSIKSVTFFCFKWLTIQRRKFYKQALKKGACAIISTKSEGTQNY